MNVSSINRVVILSLVHFKAGNIDVYPDDTKKPGEGHGLNKMCFITLFGVKRDVPNPQEQVTATVLQ